MNFIRTKKSSKDINNFLMIQLRIKKFIYLIQQKMENQSKRPYKFK